jgi:hypothetical protein
MVGDSALRGLTHAALFATACRSCSKVAVAIFRLSLTL